MLPKKQCSHCRKIVSAKGMSEHERFHCPKNPNKEKRVYSSKRCPICNKMIHEKGLRIHKLTAHGTPLQNNSKEQQKKSFLKPQRVDAIRKLETTRLQTNQSLKMLEEIRARKKLLATKNKNKRFK